MKAHNIVLAFGLTCIAALPPLIRAQTAPLKAQVSPDALRSLGRPQTFRNLTIIPVYDARATPSNAYITLDEGLKSGVVTVHESSNGGEVNTLYLTNKSKKPLYLMAGEVVLGGQQDRCIGSDALVKAGTKRLPITVFCVEHGRWTGQSRFDSSAKTVASTDIRASAQNGAFYYMAAAAPARSAVVAGNASLPAQAAGRVATNSNVAAIGGVQADTSANVNAPAIMTGRMARARMENAQAVSGEASLGVAQQQVWDKVASKNRRFKTETQSGTYRVMLNLSGGEAQRSVAPYIKALSAAPGSGPHLVGTVAAVNGKIVAADIFGNPTLFRKLWPKLLRSYASDAAENAHSGKRIPAVTEAEAQRFLRQAANGKNKIDAGGVTGVNTRLDAEHTVLYRLTDGHTKAAVPALHENVLQK